MERAAENVRAAVRGLEFPTGATVVLVSPHGSDARVYRRPRGNLEGLGVRGIGVDVEGDDAAAEALADMWVWPASTEGIDHGATVPLALGASKANRVVVASLSQSTGTSGTGVERVLSEARSLASAIRRLSETTKVVVVASANTSAGLSPRGPLTELPGAAEVEERLLEALERDVGEVEPIAEGLFHDGASCGAGPLFCLALLFPGRPASVLAHESPVGVGYIVAQVDV